ncbi:glycosyltransferase family 9 protein [Roseomonas xinghualingensis]|uniref:glycosyltransferase family 9 protein n=1 Tax=Roseomonas xinghualingensis TaxID=2986475 RepID=UPI0021F22824|nr:glycosyltransferase family 9 protein [Roseomonas sp. SXEYE001]MCV4208675.1 glycosyltransferase [Roseomonas sp. SXEYE001]
MTQKNWQDYLETAPEWLGLPGAHLSPEVMLAMEALADLPERAAVVDIFQEHDAEPVRFWRRAYLQQIIEYKIVDNRAPISELINCAARFPREHRHLVSLQPARRVLIARREETRGTVLLISQFGVQKFGGAEHFLSQMARLYRDLGYDPLIVGTRAERAGESGAKDGIPYVYISPNPAALFRLAQSTKAVLAHVLSGLGYEVSVSLRFLGTRLVFGVHFWRELFYPTTASGGYFPDCPAGHLPQPSFHALLADFDAVYANSEFTRTVVEQTFGARLNVIPSVPDDVVLEKHASQTGKSIVLLANCRFDKGYGLFIELAKRLPDIQFVGIASQSGVDAAVAAKSAACLKNVLILQRSANMAELYRAAKVVLVPSYQFVETFSRVVIEAQRFGVPVIGSDCGNVPFLLRESGISLPSDPELWVSEIRQLFDCPAYWEARSQAAIRNSEAYAFRNQKDRLLRLIEGTTARFLLGVGSGVGNIVHTTPLIRNVARHLNSRIDVVVAGDSKAALAVVANSEYVNHAFLLNDVPVRRQYDTVFLTHSFGVLLPPFRATRVVQSRSWDRFSASHKFHEAEFNLAAAEALLGIPYEEDDVRQAFFADLRWKSGKHGLVGLHAGSKTGAWSAKRWPFFANLAAALGRHGLRVASFGSADEFVPGTLDWTGGSLEEMATRMLACGAFVSNDSGVMNIANALGIPLVALFAPTEARTRGPLGPASMSIALKKSCAPCELAGREGPFFQGRCHCIGDITVDAVEAAVLKALGLTS